MEDESGKIERLKDNLSPQDAEEFDELRGYDELEGIDEMRLYELFFLAHGIDPELAVRCSVTYYGAKFRTLPTDHPSEQDKELTLVLHSIGGSRLLNQL
jgi:hypothetical protein